MLSSQSLVVALASIPLGRKLDLIVICDGGAAGIRGSRICGGKEVAVDKGSAGVRHTLRHSGMAA